jgi:ATP-dependent HslUV protease subunit HslV
MIAPQDASANGWHATTILMVRKGDRTVIGGDGQVSLEIGRAHD